MIASAHLGLAFLNPTPSSKGTTKVTSDRNSRVNGIGTRPEVIVGPSKNIQREVIAKLATLEMKVITTDRLRSPLSMAVQKLDPTPPVILQFTIQQLLVLIALAVIK